MFGALLRQIFHSSVGCTLPSVTARDVAPLPPSHSSQMHHKRGVCSMWSWCATRWSGRNQSRPDTSPWVDDLISHSRASYFISLCISAMRQSCCGNTKTEFSQEKVSQSEAARANVSVCISVLCLAPLPHLGTTTHSLSLPSLLFFKKFPQSPPSCCYDDHGPSFLLPAVLPAPNGQLGVPRGAGAPQLHSHRRYWPPDFSRLRAAYNPRMPLSQVVMCEVWGLNCRGGGGGQSVSRCGQTRRVLSGVQVRRCEVAEWRTGALGFVTFPHTHTYTHTHTHTHTLQPSREAASYTLRLRVSISAWQSPAQTRPWLIAVQ